MKTQTITQDKVRARGIRALMRELGPAGMIQFMQQFGGGRGDYTKERHRLLDDMSVDEIVDRIEGQGR